MGEHIVELFLFAENIVTAYIYLDMVHLVLFLQVYGP